jgi:integrase
MLDRPEIARLLDASPADLRALLSAALATGARFGELVALRVRDFDPAHRRVTIHQTKTGKTMSQPLTAEGVALFTALARTRSGDAFLLVRSDGSPWGRHQQHRPMAEAAAQAGLPGVTFKTTRATYGKLLLLATKDLELVSRALGHADSRITREHYAALLPSDVERGVATLPALGLAP